MVCQRCVRVIMDELNAIGVEIKEIQLGQVTVQYDSTKIGFDALKHVLRSNHFELLESKEEILAEKVKVVLRSALDDFGLHSRRLKLSELLARSLNVNYTHLSRTFSKEEGVTIERYFIRLKIEKAKELIVYKELSFKEIAYDLGYSSLQHLSGQFKQVTGMSMTMYSELAEPERNSLDKI